MRRFSNSELVLFMRCRRHWYLSHWRGLHKRVPELITPAALGNTMHLVLARFYDPEDAGVTGVEQALAVWHNAHEVALADYTQRLADAQAAVTSLTEWAGDAETLTSGFDDKEFAKQRELGAIMLEGYFEWLAESGADADWEVIASEQEVSVPLHVPDGTLLRPVELVGKLDVTVRLRSSGARSFVDHKSVTSLTDHPKRADIAPQFKHYSLLDYLAHLNRGDDPARAADSFVDGGIYNMIRKVRRRSTAKPPFYGRHHVRFNLHELHAYWQKLTGIIRDVQTVEDALAAGADHHVVAYPNPTRDCDWDCPFRQACPMFDDGSRVEDYLATVFEPHDPYERYAATATAAATPTEVSA